MKKIIAIMIACAMLIAVMTACSSHSHTETGDWEADAAGHWKLCEGCDEKLQAADHTAAGNWEVDATGHWRLCDVCGEKIQTGDHTMDDGFQCSVCGSDIIDWGDSISVYTYDEHENFIRMADYDTDGNLISETVNENEYDANGNLTRCKEYVDGRLNSESEYTVTDGESIPVKCTYYNEDGSKFINGYDSNGNVIQLIDYDADGNMTLQVDSQYAQNSDGEWYETARTEIYGDGMKIEAEYDEHWATTSRVIYDADGNVTSTESWEYTYGDNGFTATEKAYMDGMLYREITYKTIAEDGGRFNYPETVTTYTEDGSKTVCVYNENYELVSETTYDADGNMIE